MWTLHTDTGGILEISSSDLALISDKAITESLASLGYAINENRISRKASIESGLKQIKQSGPLLSLVAMISGIITFYCNRNNLSPDTRQALFDHAILRFYGIAHGKLDREKGKKFILDFSSQLGASAQLMQVHQFAFNKGFDSYTSLKPELFDGLLNEVKVQAQTDIDFKPNSRFVLVTLSLALAIIAGAALLFKLTTPYS